MREPILLIHGGAGSRALNKVQAKEVHEALEHILDHAYATLLQTHDCRKAVLHAVQLLEDDPLFNAGLGSKIQSDGKIRMSAGFMDGSALRFSGVVNVERVKNPINIASALQKEKDRVLANKGALAFARHLQLPQRSPYTKKALDDFNGKKAGKTGTVGAVALDSRGRLAAATSTGGRGFEFPQRVSDTPTVAGNYANEFAAVSATGMGEQIVEHAVAASLATRIEDGLPLDKAVEKILRKARSHKAEFGLIAVTCLGEIAAATTTTRLLHGIRTQSKKIIDPS